MPPKAATSDKVKKDESSSSSSSLKVKSSSAAKDKESSNKAKETAIVDAPSSKSKSSAPSPSAKQKAEGRADSSKKDNKEKKDDKGTSKPSTANKVVGGGNKDSNEKPSSANPNPKPAANSNTNSKPASKPSTPAVGGKRDASPAAQSGASTSLGRAATPNANNVNNLSPEPRQRKKKDIIVEEVKPKKEIVGKYGDIEVWTKEAVVKDTPVEYFAVRTPEFSPRTQKWEWLVVDFETHTSSNNKDWKGYRRVYRRHNKPYYYSVCTVLDFIKIENDDKTWGKAKELIRPLFAPLVEPEIEEKEVGKLQTPKK